MLTRYWRRWESSTLTCVAFASLEDHEFAKQALTLLSFAIPGVAYKTLTIEAPWSRIREVLDEWMRVEEVH